jgi:hypothetical protein
MVIAVFIGLQVVLFFLMTFHDWVHLPPFTDIRALEQHSSQKGRLITSTMFALMIAIPLLLTVAYSPEFPRWVLVTIAHFYGWLSLVGALLFWKLSGS